MSKFSHFAIKKLYLKRSFNNISGNCGPLLSQINFDQTYFGGLVRGGFGTGGFVQGVYVRGLFTRGYVLEPTEEIKQC